MGLFESYITSLTVKTALLMIATHSTNVSIKRVAEESLGKHSESLNRKICDEDNNEKAFHSVRVVIASDPV